jgi:hypothetical protein
MIAKINKLKNWQVAIVITIIGFAVFFTGLKNPFMGDDTTQIVSNVPVHSISNIRIFFEGSTFYAGNGLAPLSGTFYRPLQTTVFSILYTFFGAHSFYFHLFQLLLCIGSSFILFLFFKYSFKPALALMLALIFLIHPLDSQVVYSISYMQDALFFFFGILALLLLLRFRSTKSLLLVAACLLLSLLSKESGVVFIAVALLYLFWWDRKRLFKFIGIMALPVALYLALRVNAVGWISNPNNAPIDNLSLAGRLFTAPSLPILYLSKLIFPWKLASGYYWVYPTYSLSHFLLPLFIDLAVVALMVFIAVLIRKKATKAMLYTYIFFSVWSIIGLLLVLQFAPLDMTACETWFYFSMAGVLGMVGVIIKSLLPELHINSRILVAVSIIFLVVLGVRTAVRGTDYKNIYTLAANDISATKDDYAAYDALSYYYIARGKYQLAAMDATRSIDIYHLYENYFNLGVSLANEGNYQGAYAAYVQGLRYGSPSVLYENIARLSLVSGSTSSNSQILASGLRKYPRDSLLWLYLAILEARINNNAGAKVDILQSAKYGQVPQFVYNGILNNTPFTILLAQNGEGVKIQ